MSRTLVVITYDPSCGVCICRDPELCLCFPVINVFWTISKNQLL